MKRFEIGDIVQYCYGFNDYYYVYVVASYASTETAFVVNLEFEEFTEAQEISHEHLHLPRLEVIPKNVLEKSLQYGGPTNQIVQALFVKTEDDEKRIEGLLKSISHQVDHINLLTEELRKEKEKNGHHTDD